MKGNEVRVFGRVKRDSDADRVREGMSVLDFTLEVEDGGGRPVYVDCMATSPIVEDVFGGGVDAGEDIGVEGRLTFRTYTNGIGRKVSGLIVFVEGVYSISD
jgi:hypothetical protein